MRHILSLAFLLGFAANGLGQTEQLTNLTRHQSRHIELTNLAELQDQVERIAGFRPDEQCLRAGVWVRTVGTNTITFKLVDSEHERGNHDNEHDKPAPLSSGIVHGPKAAFEIKAPQGWLLDNQSGNSMGLHCVLYPEGFKWEDQKLFMYAKIASPEHSNAEDFAAWAVSHMQKQPDGLKYTRIEDGKTTEGRSFFINEYRRIRGYRRPERAVYVQLPDAVAYIVLTAENDELFDKYKDALKETAELLTYMPLFIGFDAKLKEALNGQK